MSNSLDPKIINNVSEKVYKRFPEISGTKPSIKKQGVAKKNPRNEYSLSGSSSFLLTYRGTVEVANGRKMERWIRVVVNEHGNILKMTTSR